MARKLESEKIIDEYARLVRHSNLLYTTVWKVDGFKGDIERDRIKREIEQHIMAIDDLLKANYGPQISKAIMLEVRERNGKRKS